jgi:cytochrome b561
METQRWTGTQKFLHWAVAVAVVVQLSLGFDLGDLADDDPGRVDALRTHASLGVAIFVLMVFRLAWRLSHDVPSPPETLSPMFQRAALYAHRAFYVLILIMPVSGYLLASASGEPVPLIGIELANAPVTGKAARAALWYTHAACGITISLLFIAHTGAALRHAVILKDGTLRAMLPQRRK